MLLALPDDLHAIGVEDRDPELIIPEDFEGEQVADLQVVAHSKSWPAIVNGSATIEVDDTYSQVAASLGLQDNLFWNLSKMLTKGRRDRKQIQPRCKENLAEMGWRHLLVKVANNHLPPLGSTRLSTVPGDLFALLRLQNQKLASECH